MQSGIGAKIGEQELSDLADAGSGSAQEVLFSEAQSGVLFTLRGSGDKDEKICATHQIPLYYLGLTGEETLVIGDYLKESVSGLKEIYESYPFGK